MPSIACRFQALTSRGCECRRDARARMLFAGIQSIHDKVTRTGHADLVLIDEAHLIPGRSNTIYRRFLADLQAINPALKVIGLVG